MKLFTGLFSLLLIILTFSCVGVFYASLGSNDSALVGSNGRIYTWYSEGFSFNTMTGGILDFKEDGTYKERTYGGYVNLDKHQAYIDGIENGEVFTNEQIEEAELYYFEEESGEWSTNSEYTKIRLSLSGTEDYYLYEDPESETSNSDMYLVIGKNTYSTKYEPKEN